MTTRNSIDFAVLPCLALGAHKGHGPRTLDRFRKLVWTIQKKFPYKNGAHLITNSFFSPESITFSKLKSRYLQDQMPGEEIDTVSERLNTGTDVVATTSSSEDEGYSGDYFSEESENENFSLPREETHHVRKVLKLRRRHRSSDPPSVPSSVVWYDSDDFTHESEVPPSAHEDGQPEDNNSDTTLEATLGEQCQHPCCLRPLSDSDHGQQHPYRCACGPSYSRSSPDSESASEQRIEGPLESYFNEQHSNELERFLRLGFQSPRHSMRSPDNNGPHGMVINTAETHYDIWDPQSRYILLLYSRTCYYINNIALLALMQL